MNQAFQTEWEKFITKIKVIILAIIILIGCIGNTLNLIVFGKKSLKKITAFRFLFFLSAFDILVLTIGAVEILMRNAFEFELRLYSTLTCKIHTFATYTVTHMSSTLLMTVSVKRAIKMIKMKIFQAKKHSSRKNIRESKFYEKQALDRLKNCDDMKLIKKINSKKTFKKEIVVQFNPKSTFKIKFQSPLRALHQTSGALNRKHEETSSILSKRNKKKNIFRKISDKMTVDLQVLIIFVIIASLNFHYILFIDLTETIKPNALSFFHLLLQNGTMTYTFEKTDTFLGAFFNLNSIYAERKCFAGAGTKYEFFLQEIWFWVDLSIYSLLPFIVMTISSIIIIIKFKKMNRSYFEFISNPRYQFNRRNYLKKIKKNRQICLMLLNSDFFFFISNLQYWVGFFMFRYKSSQNEFFQNYYSFSYVLLYSHNAFEFLIFSFSSEKYRKELYSIFF